jgi:hypothetical protein
MFHSILTSSASVLLFSFRQGRSFDERIVDVKFYPEDAFRSMHYSADLPPVIITASYGATAANKIFTASALKKISAEEGDV